MHKKQIIHVGVRIIPLLIILTLVYFSVKFIFPNIFIFGCSEDFVRKYEIALQNHNYIFCYEQLGESNEERIKSIRTALFRFDKKCRLPNNEVYSYVNCVRRFANKTQNIKVCELQGGWFCFNMVKNVTYTDCIEIKNGKDNCLRLVAGRTTNMSICEGLSYDIIKRLCFKDVAVAKNDTSLCNENLGSELIINRCYEEIAIKLK